MISVIVPLFNYAEYINDCLQSILKQSVSDFEIIVVDDCSTDNSFDIVEKITSQYKDKVRLFKLEKNTGYSAAKNYGIIKSQGEFIVHIDADDMLLPFSLEKRLKLLLKYPDVMWCHGRALCFSGQTDNSELENDLYERWCNIKKGKWPKSQAWKAVHAQTVMVRRDLYKKVGLYDENMRCSADREMWRRILNQQFWPAFVHDPVCLYRYHKKQMHKSKFKVKNKDEINQYMDHISNVRKNGINASNTRMLIDASII